MAGCNCKNKDKDTVFEKSGTEQGIIGTVFKYFAKSVGLLIGFALIPFIIVYIMWVMFDVIMLNKDLDLRTILNGFIKVNKYFDRDEEYDDDDDYILPEDNEILTDDNVIMVNVEDITHKRK